MRRALLKTVVRDLFRRPLQTALMVFGVALGVSILVAIDSANLSATRSFDLSTETIVGRATHQVQGGPTEVFPLNYDGRLPRQRTEFRSAQGQDARWNCRCGRSSMPCCT